MDTPDNSPNLYYVPSTDRTLSASVVPTTLIYRYTQPHPLQDPVNPTDTDARVLHPRPLVSVHQDPRPVPLDLLSFRPPSVPFPVRLTGDTIPTSPPRLHPNPVLRSDPLPSDLYPPSPDPGPLPNT